MSWKQIIFASIIISLAMTLAEVSSSFEYGIVLRILALIPITYYVAGYYKYKNKVTEKEKKEEE